MSAPRPPYGATPEGDREDKSGEVCDFIPGPLERHPVDCECDECNEAAHNVPCTDCDCCASGDCAAFFCTDCPCTSAPTEGDLTARRATASAPSGPGPS